MFNPKIVNTVPTAVPIPTWIRGCNVAGINNSYPTQFPVVIYPTAGNNNAPIVANDTTYLVSKGINCVRLLPSQETLVNSTYGELNSYLTNLKTMISSLTGAGIYVFLGTHQGADANFGAWQGVQYTVGGTTPGSIMAEFYHKLANEFKSNSLVGYDLTNEPLIATTTWVVVAQNCIDAIRGAGSGQCIAINGAYYSGSSSWSTTSSNDPGVPKMSNADAMLLLKDPCNNLVFEVHCYADGNGGTTDTVLSTTELTTNMANVVSWATTNGKRLLIGEWGVKSGQTNAAGACTNFVNYFKANSVINGGPIVGHLWWTYSYPAYYAGYRFRLAPADNSLWNTDDANMTMLTSAGAFTNPVAFNPLTSVPNIYARWRAQDYASGTIADSSGLAADATKTMIAATSAGWTAPVFSSSDATMNNQASVGQTAAGAWTAFSNNATIASATNLATPIAGACTVYGVYYISAAPTPSTCYLRSSKVPGTSAGGPSLFYFYSYQASRDGTNIVGGATGASGTGTTVGVRIICNVYNGASSATYVNSSTALATGNAGTTSITSISLGNKSGEEALWKIGQTLIYSSAHSSTDITNMMNYLGGIYGITIT